MAIPHFSVGIVARGRGASAVLSAAYRHCARMELAREARLIDYSRKEGLAHEEFFIPVEAPAWLRSMVANRSAAAASEAFWNRVEDFEKRSDAQLARDVTIALPIELTLVQNITLVREFVARHIAPLGMVADWVVHDAPGNPHVHLMTTLRPLTDDGFGPKKVAIMGSDGKALRNDCGRKVYGLWAGGLDDFNSFRDGWFACQNRHLALAGLDLYVDGRSLEQQGTELIPTIHLGVSTKAISRKDPGGTNTPDRAAVLERLKLQEERRADNALRIQRNPQLVVDLIMRERSVFGALDVARILSRYIDDAELFQNLMVRILQSPPVLRLEGERIDLTTGVRIPAKYTTRAVMRLETQMASRASWLSAQTSHGLPRSILDSVFARHDRLSQEQRMAIEHLTGKARVAAIVGRAGAGKTTMMKAAREAWEAHGYRVVGGALAGKAAEGLDGEAGIASRTLSSWELAWGQGRGRIDARTIFVLDEAGMVASRQMAVLLEAITRAGAKLVLIGDPDQLQPIEAGAAFRAIAERIGYAELETVYRQHVSWMREASLDLACGRVGRALKSYETQGRLKGAQLKTDAVAQLIADWIAEYDPSRSTLILAHMRRDVRMLNTLARTVLIERGFMEPGLPFQTSDGPRSFAVGDQIVFLKNEGSIGVKNGMLARVVEIHPGRIVAVLSEGMRRRMVVVEQHFYNMIDHGYATTIHKAQGATVDRVKVLASLSLDRHLTYVAMTRHREELGVYYGRRSFERAGGLVEVLSRRNAKETTLDYANASFYREALRFAERRGFNLINVARTMLADRLSWVIGHKHKLVSLAGRLTALGARIRVAASTVEAMTCSDTTRQQKPMVAGIETFPISIDQFVEDSLAADPVLRTHWAEVSMRFHHVYGRPSAAFKAIDVDAMLRDHKLADTTITTIATAPETFGTLKGKAGLLASSAEQADRKRAISNVVTLADSLRAYLGQRSAAQERVRNGEITRRRTLSTEIPGLSVKARLVLERAREAIDHNGIDAGLSPVLADMQVKLELDGFIRAVSTRFGDRTFLPLAAREVGGALFKQLTAGMNGAQKAEVRLAWPLMRTAQQLASHERVVRGLEASEVVRQTKTQRVTLQ